MKQKEEIIKNYIEAYNRFDVDGMIEDFDEAVVFENVQNGQVTLTLTGLEQFIKQAELAKSYFTERRQSMAQINHYGNRSKVDIDYTATAAADFTNGVKKGDKLTFKGKSIFEFSEAGKIIKLTDIT